MDTATPLYDDTIETQLNALTCKLDETPHISTNPVEASSYLGITLMESEEGFQQTIERVYKEFKVYMDSFAKECISTNNNQAVLKPTISRIISIYNTS